MRPQNPLPVLGALVLAAIACLLAAALAVRVIETSSARTVAQQMMNSGHEWATVQTDGLQVILEGEAPSETARIEALRAAGHVVDSARVINAMQVAEREAIPAPRFSIEILRNDDGVSMMGLVPAAWDMEAAMETIEATTGVGEIVNFIESADYPVPERWDAVMNFGLMAVRELPRSKLSLAADRITVTALADSETQKSRFETDLNRAKPRGMPVTIDITAPRPVITPFTLRFVIDDDGAHFDACSAETPQGHARILAAARAAGVDSPACTLGLGSPSPRWAEAVRAGLEAVNAMGAGSVTFSDTDVSLLAGPQTTRAAFDVVSGDLKAALPSTFTLHAEMPVVVDATPSDAVIEFTAQRSTEGRVQLRGRIADERTETATESYARALFGAGLVYSAMNIDETLPEGWSLRTLAALEALSWLNDGSVTMTADEVRVSGNSGAQTAKAEIARILSDKLGDGAVFDIDVTYVKRLDETLALPTPAECVADLNSVMAANKIIFDSGSAEVSQDSARTLDDLADVLRKCDGAAMEVAGYTDSSGGEEGNLSLSQARADAVVNALIGRRVLDVALTAKGYGEADPVADNGTEEGREANRRIEFRLAGDTARAQTADETGDAPTENAPDSGAETETDEGTTE
ncbi:OmpA family protein [Aquimixticola soesokkakensis]|nr:OmpA family protein [Aquimixticola soesokkakensis]